MATTTTIAITTAVFLGFHGFGTGELMAQGSGVGVGQTTIGTASPGLAVPRGRRPPGRRFPLELRVQIDAMAFINEWRAEQQYSRLETPRRSGVRINGTRVGAAGSEREVLFACSGNAFLDLTVGIQQPDGSVLVDDGPSAGCDPRQALVFNGDRLACNWYSPPPGTSALEDDTEIVLATVPPVSIAGQCITGSAQVVPAMVFPEGRPLQAGIRQNCGGSGVVVNGRVTGQMADCLR